MAGFFGSDFDPTAPPDTENASNGANRIRDIKQRIKTFMGVLFNLENGNLSPNVIPASSLQTISGLPTGAITNPIVTVNPQGLVTVLTAGTAGSYKTAGAVETYLTGGTGLTALPTNGQVVIGNGSGYSLSTLTVGQGITITNGAGTITIAVNASFFPQFPFYASATLSSATAGTAIQLLADLSTLNSAFSTRQVFLQGFLAKVDGATAWTTTTAVNIQDNNSTPNLLVTIPVANLTANATIGMYTSGITLQPTFTRALGGAIGKGLKIVADVNAGAGSNLIVQAWGVLQ